MAGAVSRSGADGRDGPVQRALIDHGVDGRAKPSHDPACGSLAIFGRAPDRHVALGDPGSTSRGSDWHVWLWRLRHSLLSLKLLSIPSKKL
jgi:hypothetical protein